LVPVAEARVPGFTASQVPGFPLTRISALLASTVAVPRRPAITKVLPVGAPLIMPETRLAPGAAGCGEGCGVCPVKATDTDASASAATRDSFMTERLYI